MSHLRKQRSSCDSSNQQQYTPFMLGQSPGFGVSNSLVPPSLSVNTMSVPAAPAVNSPMRTISLDQANVGVRDCMYWPASIGNQRYMPPSNPSSYYQSPSNVSSGDYQYCTAPPKAYISGPGKLGSKDPARSISCQVAPLGTDPMSLIKPMNPLTVRVQAPHDLFTGTPGEVKTISISPAQLYNSR